MKDKAEDPESMAFDLQLILEEIDVLAEDLTRLEPSMDRTALELRLAQMRQIVELVYTRQGQAVDGLAATHGV
jgi:hypothetical protein